MEQTPKRRLIIRKKQVAVVEEDKPAPTTIPPTTIPPTHFGQNCTFFPVIYDYTPKKCRCGGMYTSDSEYVPRECCGLEFKDYEYIPWDGTLPDQTYKQGQKEKFYSGFCKPVLYDFINDKTITPTLAKVETKVEDKPRFSFMPASQLRDTQRDDRRYHHETRREDRRDYRESRRDDRRDCRESRESSRDREYHRNHERDYERTWRHSDRPNSHNGRREPSKSKNELDSELGKYSRKF
jgi:hypothetical protein